MNLISFLKDNNWGLWEEPFNSQEDLFVWVHKWDPFDLTECRWAEYLLSCWEEGTWKGQRWSSKVMEYSGKDTSCEMKIYKL